MRRTVGIFNLRKIIVLTMVIGPLVATGYALYLSWNGLANWRDVALLGGMYTVVAFGVTVGYHRLLTHDSFRTHRAVRFLLVVLGCMSMEGAPITWASNHRQHHAYADSEGDPHSPQLSRNIFLGFFHAHMGWLMEGQISDPDRWARDLQADPDMRFLQKTSLLFFLLSFIIPFAIGGWTGLLWGGLVRMFLTHHVTWSVNSVCHVFGARPFKVKDQSGNQWLVGLLGFGEGAHNTHHASPRSARHGLYWWHFDMSWILIQILAKLRLAHDVYTLDEEDLKRALARHAAGIKVTLLYPSGRSMPSSIEADGTAPIPKESGRGRRLDPVPNKSSAG